MYFEELVYYSTCYLRDNGFVVAPGADKYNSNIYIYKDKYYDAIIIDDDFDNDIDVLFGWNEVCDELEPLLTILYRMDLLDYITIDNVAIRNIKFTFPVKDHISDYYYGDEVNLSSIFSNISREVNLARITINCKHGF